MLDRGFFSGVAKPPGATRIRTPPRRGKVGDRAGRSAAEEDANGGRGAVAAASPPMPMTNSSGLFMVAAMESHRFALGIYWMGQNKGQVVSCAAVPGHPDSPPRPPPLPEPLVTTAAAATAATATSKTQGQGYGHSNSQGHVQKSICTSTAIAMSHGDSRAEATSKCMSTPTATAMATVAAAATAA